MKNCDVVPHIEIKKAHRLWKDERPFFSCSMEQLHYFIKSEDTQDKLQGLIEWIQRYGYVYPQYSKYNTFIK